MDRSRERIAHMATSGVTVPRLPCRDRDAAGLNGEFRRLPTVHIEQERRIAVRRVQLEIRRNAGRAAHLFFRLVNLRYERGGFLLTSNRPVGEWGTVFGDAVVATAILDRLLQHSHVITIRGESYRPREKRGSGLFKGFTSAPAPPLPTRRRPPHDPVEPGGVAQF